MFKPDAEEKKRRIRNFLSGVRSNMQTPDTSMPISVLAINHLKSSYALIEFGKLGFFEKIAKGAWAACQHPNDFTDSDIELMANADWSAPKKQDAGLFKHIAENVAPMVPITQAEQVFKHVSAIADLMGKQFGNRTPAGLAQELTKKELEICKLRGEIKELREDMEKLNNVFNKVRK